jgi:hypothetical protein
MWKRIMAIKIAALVFAIAIAGSSALGQTGQPDLHVATRFGDLAVGEDKILLFRGHPLYPPIHGNNNLDVGEPFHIGATDVALVTNNGGTACPFLYHFVIVSESGAKATSSFGTCNSVEKTKRVGDSISLTMSGYRGPFEPEAEIRKAAMETHVFVFRDGVVTENGKPVPRK